MSSTHWEDEFYAHLHSSVSLRTQLAGGSITWDLAPTNGIKPYIVLMLVGTQGETTLNGPSGIDFPRVQLTCWHPDRNTARDLRKVLRTAVEGLVISGASNIVATFQDEHNLYDPGARLFGAILELKLALNPQIP